METATDTWGLDDLFPEDEPLLEDLEPTGEAFLPLAPIYKEPEIHPLSEWPAQLPMALALQVETVPEILDRFDITPERFELLKPLPAFRKAVSDAAREVRENGYTFKMKCRGIAEDFLDNLYQIMHDAATPISTKFEMMKYLVKMAGLEPAPVAAAQANQQAVQININL